MRRTKKNIDVKFSDGQCDEHGKAAVTGYRGVAEFHIEKRFTAYAELWKGAFLIGEWKTCGVGGGLQLGRARAGRSPLANAGSVYS